MASEEIPELTAPSFGRVAAAYDRGRPGYSREAVAWLTGEQPLSILELGAGTGKLTEQLVALGHDVHATDPDPGMLDHLARTVYVSKLSQTGAEEIPGQDESYDLVIAGAAYQYFDKERALPEIARVLKRSGSFALVWNVRDERIPWVKRLGGIVGRHEVEAAGPDEELEASPYFGPLEEKTFKQWQTVHSASIDDFVLADPVLAEMDAEARKAKIAEVSAFYEDYGRGMDGMQLPYLTRCFRAVAAVRPPKPAPPVVETAPDASAAHAGEDTAPWARTGPSDGERAMTDTGSLPATGVPGISDPPANDDTGMLLIDFR